MSATHDAVGMATVLACCLASDKSPYAKDAAALLDLLRDLEADSDEDDEPDDAGICSTCNGSGEGMYDGSTCRDCRGSGSPGGWSRG